MKVGSVLPSLGAHLRDVPSCPRSPFGLVAPAVLPHNKAGLGRGVSAGCSAWGLQCPQPLLQPLRRCPFTCPFILAGAAVLMREQHLQSALHCCHSALSREGSVTSAGAQGCVFGGALSPQP